MNRLNQFVTAISFVLFINSSSHGQIKGDHEITVGLGAISTDKMVHDVGNGFSTLMTFGTSSVETTSSGVFNIGYKYAASRRFKIGVVFVHEKIHETYNSVFGSSGSEPNTSRFLTAAVESDFRYVLKPAFQMYSGLGIGYTLIDSYTFYGANHANFHINAIGLRIGKAVALRMELGLGYKGVFNAGLSVQL